MHSTSGRTTLTFLIGLGLVGFLTPGCDRLQSPSRSDCDAAINKVIRLEARAEAGKGSIAAWALAAAGNLGTRVTGAHAEAVDRCMADFTRHRVNCVLKANDSAAASDCENW